MSNDKTTLHSYHTFIFPFLWNENGRVKLKQFQKCLSDFWEIDYLQETPFNEREYARWCYFNQAARNAVFTEKTDKTPIVINYHYNIGRLFGDKNSFLRADDPDNPVEYRISKNIYEYDEKSGTTGLHHFEAALKVRSLRLKLFTTGVGLLVFDLENYEDGTERYINEINEYGRRVFSPYISDDSCGLCADCIAFSYPDSGIFDRVAGHHTDRSNELCLAQPLTHLLSGNGYTVTTNAVHSNTEFYIEPIIDDRMFVATFYINKPLTDEVMQWDDQNERYQYLTDALRHVPYQNSLAHRLYKLVFVDGNGISCHNRHMLYDLLEKHLYTRWLETYFQNSDNGKFKSDGSFIGITEYSFIQVASSDFLARSAFLPMYVDMVMLVLAQRASLLSFERQISDSSRGKLDINAMQYEYVKFQSRLLLREVTPQQQGIELYDMLLDNLFIDKEKSDLESQIQALFSEQTGSNERLENIILTFLAAFGVFDVVAMISDPLICTWEKLIAFAIIAIIIGAMCVIRKRRLK